MIRFLAFSLLIHLGFYAAITWRPTEVVEDPIVSVTLQEDLDDKPDTPKPRPQPAKPKPIATSSTTKSPPAEPSQETPSTETPNANETNSGSGEHSSGNVSVKPRVLRSFKAEYPDAAKQARVEGAVRLSVLIDTKGQVQEAVILEGPGHGLNETAQEALRKFVFSPAEKDGEKVAVRIVYVYRFRLESR